MRCGRGWVGEIGLTDLCHREQLRGLRILDWLDPSSWTDSLTVVMMDLKDGGRGGQGGKKCVEVELEKRSFKGRSLDD